MLKDWFIGEEKDDIIGLWLGYIGAILYGFYFFKFTLHQF